MGHEASNCDRVQKTVGREDLAILPPLNMSKVFPFPTGGVWFSHPAAGMCKLHRYVGDGSGCTWRVVEKQRTIHAPCMYTRIDSAVEQHNKSCFRSCKQPYNHTSDCYLECYSETVNAMAEKDLKRHWLGAFALESEGGCPEATKTANQIDL